MVSDLVRAGRIAREATVVVSKIGYVQGQNLALAREREAADRPFAGMVQYQDTCWHCVHPEFLEDQFERSLTRLSLQTLDVCLLHNPEYFLSDAANRRAGSIEAVRDEFYRRLAEAFRFFETQVAAGRLGWYGVSSNTVAQPVDGHEATSLTRMLAAAHEASGPDHHFAILQLPLNLLRVRWCARGDRPAGRASGRAPLGAGRRRRRGDRGAGEPSPQRRDGSGDGAPR